jgi:hypothetical protein
VGVVEFLADVKAKSTNDTDQQDTTGNENFIFEQILIVEKLRQSL